MNEEEAVIFVRDIYVADKMVNGSEGCGRYCLLHGIEVGYQYGSENLEIPDDRCDSYMKGIKIGRRKWNDRWFGSS